MTPHVHHHPYDDWRDIMTLTPLVPAVARGTRLSGCREGGIFMPFVHGHAGSLRQRESPTYCSWRAMIDRCLGNGRHVQWYKDRGITVCENWLSFVNFLADMGERPEGKTLDRINRNGNYEPGNCRWATSHEQQLNRRPRIMCLHGHPLSGDNLLILYNGGRRCRICQSAVAGRYLFKKKAQR